MTRQLLAASFILLCVPFGCATDPTTTSPIAGSAIEFTYETGSVKVVVNVETSRSRSPTINAAALLTDLVDGKYEVATKFASEVSAVLPSSFAFTFSDCPNAEAPTILGPPILHPDGLYNLLAQSYPANCIFTSDTTVSATATVTVSKTGQPDKILNGTGNTSTPPTPATHHTIFVTSDRYSGNRGGVSGADSTCQTVAASGTATSTLGGTWRAIVSTAASNASSRITFESGSSIKNTNGATVVANSSDLWGGTLLTPVGYDQNGSPGAVTERVWTGSTASGTHGGNADCSGWTNSTFGWGHYGDLTSATSTWISAGDSTLCKGPPDSEASHLYCINSSD